MTRMRAARSDCHLLNQEFGKTLLVKQVDN